jgi:hypothetical protein
MASTFGVKVKSWKETTNEYNYLHKWVGENKGKAHGCRICGFDNKYKKYEWSNISGKYLWDLDDYESLCMSCHRRKDHAKDKNRSEICVLPG